MDFSWKDILWISCILFANILFYIRKASLAKYGYGLSFFDLEFKDSNRLSEIIGREETPFKIFYFRMINGGIRVSLLLGIIVFVLARIIKI